MKSARIERALVVITILFINLCLLIPVWQSAVNSQLRFKLAQTEEELRDKEEQKMVLLANIAKQTTPEYLIEQSLIQNLVFTQISSETSSLIASNK
ncbi:MAG: hypothetical protein IKT95_06265 [Spirochaetales bacterium]|nr:hypothetical protein [Spirochaetales bacterium]